MTRARRIGFLVYPDIEIIDLCGPLDAFVYADCWTRERKRADELGYDLRVIAPKPGPVKTMCGVEIVATHGLEDVTEGLDTLIVAGGIGIVQACAEPALVEWVKMIAPGVRLAAAYPSLRVDPNLIFVRDGNIYTSGGITSGIDLALALIEEDLGRDIPRFVAGTMVVFLRRPGGRLSLARFCCPKPRTAMIFANCRPGS
jgi:transcriptional regulator GlxA family with amidase domain